MPKKNKIEQEYESLEKDIHQMAEKEINNIEKAVKKLEKKAEKIGEEIESQLTEKSVKSKNSNTLHKHSASNWRK
jgi:predicted  nucleic acid-binding Zn-ribbon protein